ncbi:MAG: hypothetical protein ABH879_04785 [archaeon]
MRDETFLYFGHRILKKCGLDTGYLVYSLCPNTGTGDYAYCFFHNIENQKKILDCAVDVFTGKHRPGRSFEHLQLLKSKEPHLASLRHYSQQHLKGRPLKISAERKGAALGMVSSLYLETFFNPIPFFLPYSSQYCGQFELWDRLDYLHLKENCSKDKFNSALIGKLSKDELWRVQISKDMFPLVVWRRLEKENTSAKFYDPGAMIKAMIILIGEAANIKYEIMDQVLRSFMRHAGFDKYIRADAEIRFLKTVENRIKKAVADVSLA